MSKKTFLKEESVINFFKLHGVSDTDKSNCRAVGSVDNDLSKYVSGKDIFIKKTSPITTGDELEIMYKSSEYISGFKLVIYATYECFEHDDHSFVLRHVASRCTEMIPQV